METVEVHSRSFVVKWIQIPDNATVIFQLKPIKKSISFAIYRSNETSNGNSLSTDTAALNNLNISSSSRRRSNSTLSMSLDDRLKQSALDIVESYGQLSGNELYENQLKVEKGGIFAFIFDNTRSKNYSKKVLFNKFFIYEPENSKNLATSSNSSLNVSKLLHPEKGQLLQGYLLKKKRKKLQGFTKRFFILNFKYKLLSYYMNENSLKTRGEMQINLSTISAFKEENTIVIDSGMEVWILKTLTGDDWDNWINALDFIKLNNTTTASDEDSKNAIHNDNHDANGTSGTNGYTAHTPNPQIIVGTEPFGEYSPVSNLDSTDSESKIRSDYYDDENNNNNNDINENNYDITQTFTAQQLVSINTKVSSLSKTIQSISNSGQLLDDPKISRAQKEVNDLSKYLNSLLNSSTQKSLAVSPSPPSSIPDEEDQFFDAVESSNTLNDHVFLLPGHQDSKFTVDDLSDDDLSSSDSIKVTGNELTALHPTDLFPLPINELIKRRNDVPKSTCRPESLFSFLRKNVGKDLATISMPVTSNEPLTILQKIAENFEHCNLLNEACLETDQHIKILKIATFAMASLSAMRSKERNLRKPFNPILGETFEYVSPELGFRLLGEKICHKPQIFAFHVESKDWEISLSLNPEQKFWGKSVELVNKGVTTLILKETKEVFKWSQPSTLLKNIIAGERYCEPNSSITVSSSIGFKSIVEFEKQTNGGLFSGPSRTEKVKIQVFDEQNNKTNNYTAEGKWTETISIVNTKKGGSEKIWQASKLLPNENQKWGFTQFAANLNEITIIESDNIPHTDSRYRPDVKAYEAGKTDQAEKLKLEVEQKQRDQRKILEDEGKVHVPNFFKKVAEMEYEFLEGPQSYWERRRKREWIGINQLW